MALLLTKLICSPAKFAFHIFLCAWISMIIQEMKIEEKVKINRNFDAADDRWLDADKARPVSIEFPTSFALWVKQRIFPILKQKHGISYFGPN